MEETKPTRKETTLREEDAGDLNEYALGLVLHPPEDRNYGRQTT